jgi:predicted metal-dependent phosphoesterase TrpH
MPAISHHDLHCHSTRSDGVLTPAEVVARAAERGVRVLSLTDHDEVSGLPEARTQAEACGIELVSGVEISTTWRGHTIHVVGLHVEAENEVLLRGLTENRSGRDGRAARMSAQLAAIGVPGTLEGALSYVTNPALVSRTHFARFLVESGHVNNTQAAFDRYLGEGKPGFVPHSWATLQDAVSWIRAAGGLPVLAHPGRYKLDEMGREALLNEFKSLGGVAVEVVTGSHTPDQYLYWARRVRSFGLRASAGSDFHGGRDTYRDLGELPPLPSGCEPVWSLF